jgi:hypothetical protein
MPRGSQPGERRGGRQKGTPNRVTRDLREMIEGALEDVGGRGYLVGQARENPTAFLALLKGLLPKQVSADIRAQTEIVDKRREIDAMVDALLRPGAVQKAPGGGVVLNIPATVTEARLNRPDGRGPPGNGADGTHEGTAARAVGGADAPGGLRGSD